MDGSSLMSDISVDSNHGVCVRIELLLREERCTPASAGKRAPGSEDVRRFPQLLERTVSPRVNWASKNPKSSKLSFDDTAHAPVC